MVGVVPHKEMTSSTTPRSQTICADSSREDGMFQDLDVDKLTK